MDTSEKYIKMCEQAQEIQDLRKFLDSGNKFELWEDSDFCHIELSSQNKEFDLVKSRTTIFNKSFQYFLCDSKCLHYSEAYSKTIWLPRQDQLQEIYFLNSDDKTLDKFISSLLSVLYLIKWENNHCSFEQLWLAFTMKEKYNKLWNEANEQWESIKLIIK